MRSDEIARQVQASQMQQMNLMGLRGHVAIELYRDLMLDPREEMQQGDDDKHLHYRRLARQAVCAADVLMQELGLMARPS